MAVLSVHRRLAPLVRSRRGSVRGRGRREQRASRVHAACGPPLSSPFDEHSRGNQDAIMIRVLIHRWHSAGEESDRYSVRSSRAARATACAAQAQERERRCVSTPSRHSRGGERHAREGGQPPLSRASSTRRAPACAARVCKQEQQRVSMPSQRSRGDERHAREGDHLRKSRAASGVLRPSTRAGAAACIDAESTQSHGGETPARVIRCPRAEHRISVERRPAPLAGAATDPAVGA